MRLSAALSRTHRRCPHVTALSGLWYLLIVACVPPLTAAEAAAALTSEAVPFIVPTEIEEAAHECLARGDSSSECEVTLQLAADLHLHAQHIAEKEAARDESAPPDAELQHLHDQSQHLLSQAYQHHVYMAEEAKRANHTAAAEGLDGGSGPAGAGLWASGEAHFPLKIYFYDLGDPYFSYDRSTPGHCHRAAPPRGWPRVEAIKKSCKSGFSWRYYCHIPKWLCSHGYCTDDPEEANLFYVLLSPYDRQCTNQLGGRGFPELFAFYFGAWVKVYTEWPYLKAAIAEGRPNHIMWNAWDTGMCEFYFGGLGKECGADLMNAIVRALEDIERGVMNPLLQAAIEEAEAFNLKVSSGPGHLRVMANVSSHHPSLVAPAAANPAGSSTRQAGQDFDAFYQGLGPRVVRVANLLRQRDLVRDADKRRQYLEVLRATYPGSPDRTAVGFLNYNGRQGAEVYFRKGLDVRLASHDSHVCGPLCGFSQQALHAHSPWTHMREVSTAEEAFAEENALRDLNRNASQYFYLPMEVHKRERPNIFFFAGTMRYHMGDAGMSGNSRSGALRHEVWRYHHEREGYVIQDRCLRDLKHRCHGTTGYVAPSEEIANLTKQPSLNFAKQMSSTQFCLSAPGQQGGDSDRYLPAVLLGCIPVVMPADDTMPFEDDVIPWDEFSVRLAPEDIPRLHEILASVSAAQQDAMRLRMSQYWQYLLYTSLGAVPHRLPLVSKLPDAMHALAQTLWHRASAGRA
mmetsp:Transcript_6263/g.23078  ORF Transcript_6263/g.23078 Transcript_6263/m.23078 type:complete len:742 (-) Transcript_6263:220-2445(-)